MVGEISNNCDVCGKSPVFIAARYGEIETKYCMDCAFFFEPEAARLTSEATLARAVADAH